MTRTIDKRREIGTMTERVLRIQDIATRRGPAGGSGRAGEQLELTPSLPGGPRRFARRWMAAGMIILFSLLAVLFVANAIKVNELMGSITEMESERDDARRANEALRAELTRLMSVEQIVNRAKELGMVEPKKPPVPIGAGPSR